MVRDILYIFVKLKLISVNKNMINKIIIFDFDGTLFHTPTDIEGKKIWLEKTGLVWPYTGWWGKAETLNTDIFYVPINQYVLSKYKEAKADPEAYVVLLTGRLQKVANMRKNVETILAQHGLEFDEVHLSWGETFRFKTRMMESLMSKFKVDDLIMYDDRHAHIVKFKEWSIGQPSNITIIDVTNKEVTRIENK